MEETYQLTSAPEALEFGKHVALLTDARFSGVSTGACIGHVSPEALAGGPIGKVRDGDLIEIVVDRQRLDGRVNLVEAGAHAGAEAGRASWNSACRARIWPLTLACRRHTTLAALQDASGGAWGGSVFDVEAILKTLTAGKKALES